MSAYYAQIPFGSFVLTSGGETATGQVSMGKNKIRTIGISMLGGNARISGRYELGIDYVGAVVNVRRFLHVYYVRCPCTDL